MAHWEDRPEPAWRRFAWNQPYAKGLERVKKLLAETDYDPATLWQWGTMQAMSLVEVLKECEARLGAEGQALVSAALRRVGEDIGRQVLAGTKLPDDLTEVELASFYATIINRIVYASLEAPRIDGDVATFDILFCPHQDHYGAFDCRIQRYLVQGMIDAARAHFGSFGYEVRFDSTIPAGAETCHFTMWKPNESERAAWDEKTRQIEERALLQIQKRKG